MTSSLGTMFGSTGNANGAREVLDGSASPRLPDPNTSRALARDGWVVVDLLDGGEVDAVAQAFEDIAGASNVPMYSSWWQPLEERRATDAAIRAIVLPRLRDLLPSFEMVFSGFMAKMGGSETSFPIHQDPTLVDEPRVASLTFWSPLMDVTIETGCMQAIPASHRFDDCIRPAFSAFPYSARQTDLAPLLRPIPMRAGQVLLFHPGLFHASTPNLEQKRRIACAGMMVPEGAQVRYCRRREATPLIDVYAVEPGFYVRVRPEDPTDSLDKVAEVKSEPRALDIDALMDLAACPTG